MSALLDGRTAIVTGAASGIGRAIAEKASAAGARLVLGDVDMDRLATVAVELERRGAAVVARYCDVRDFEQVNALVAHADRTFAPPDIVFANAGVEGPLGEPWACGEDEFIRVIDINLIGVWRTIAAVLPGMVARKAGAVVATASVAGLVGAGGLAPYVASKHGVVGLVKSIAVSVAKSGVRVNALCPGMVETALLDRLTAAQPALRETLLALKPMGRLGEADEIANAAIFLASDEASFMTGHALAVDGGYAAQ